MQEKFWNSPRTGPILAVLYLAFLLFSPCYKSACLPPEGGQSAEDTEHANDGTKPSDAVGALTKTRNGEAEKESASKKQESCGGGIICRTIWPLIVRFADKTITDPVAAFTVILAVSTIGLWLQTRRLAEGAEGQSEDMKASIAAAQKSATAAEQSAKAAIGTSLPILHIEKISGNIDFNEDSIRDWLSNFRPRIHIRNYGGSPAFIDEIILNVKVDKILPKDPTYEKINKFPKRSVLDRRALRNFTEYLFDPHERFTAEEIQAVMDGDLWLHVFGCILFRNYLDDRHSIGFAFFLHSSTGNFSEDFTAPNYNYQT